MYTVMDAHDKSLLSAPKRFDRTTDDVYIPPLNGMLQGLVVVHFWVATKIDNYLCSGGSQTRLVNLCSFGLHVARERDGASEMCRCRRYNAKVCNHLAPGVIL